MILSSGSPLASKTPLSSDNIVDSAALGQAEETNTANAVTWLRTVTVSIATETDTANSVIDVKSVGVSTAIETDTANSTSALKSYLVGLSTETDTANAVTVENAIPVGLATETDTANATTWLLAYPVSLATETDTAQTVAAFKAYPVALATETDTANQVLIVLTSDFDILMPHVLPYKDMVMVWTLNPEVIQDLSIVWNLTDEVSQDVQILFDLLSYTPVASNVDIRYSLKAAPTTLDINQAALLTKTLTGELVDYDSISISTDESSWAWTFNASLAGAAEWNALKPSSNGYIEASYTIGVEVFNLLIEGASRNRQAIDTTYQVTGRSKTALLSAPHSDQVTQTWENVTGKSIVQGLCTAAGITLAWSSDSMDLLNYESEQKYPIEIINELAGFLGAVVQSNPEGDLIVRPRYAVSPNLFDAQSPDYTVLVSDDTFSLSETWENRPGYDCIEVGNESGDDDGTDDDLTVSFEVDESCNEVLVNVYVKPFQALTLSNAGGLEIILQGVETKSVTDCITIIDGQGSLSSNFYGLTSSTYYTSSLGTLTIKEDGSVTTATEGNGLVEVIYTTKYYVYRATSANDKALIYIDEPA